MDDNEEIQQVETEEQDESWGDRTLSPDRPLSPRHRKFAELLAQGKKNSEIVEELGLSESRVSVLKSNSRIKELTAQIAERIYEETIGQRLKKLAEPALNNVEMILNDRTNRVKVSEKADMSRWVLEKLDGKAAQKFDVGENLLGVMMDRLDALKSAGKSIDAERDVIEISATPQIEGKVLQKESNSEEDALKRWVADFASLPNE